MEKDNTNKLSYEELRKLLFLMSLGYEVPPIVYDTVKKVAIEEIEKKKRPVLLKRDPDIHRRRIQAAYVKIIDGETIEIPPPICSGFGADFDGDSICSEIVVYTNPDFYKYPGMKLHIRDFMDYFPCILSNVDENSCIKKFLYSIDFTSLGETIYVPSLNIQTGKILTGIVVGYSIHVGLDMWNLYSENYNVKDLCVSTDHSLVVYDNVNGIFKRETVCNFYSIKDTHSFVRFIPYFYEDSTEYRIELLPLKDFRLEKSRERIGYDLTIYCSDSSSSLEGTFITSEGVFVYDTMAVFALLTREAQEEAKKKMIVAFDSNKLNSTNFELTNEVLLGIYIATKDAKDKENPIIIRSIEDAKKLYPTTTVKINFKKSERITTAGRIVFNSLLPEWYPFVDEEVNKKKINKIFSSIISKDVKDYVQTLDRVMKFGFEYATRYPRSVSLDILVIPDNIKKLKEKLAKEKNVYEQMKIINQMEEELKKYIKENVPDLADFVFSGASKGIGQLRQIMIAKGLFTDPDGNLLPPISRSMLDGYSPEEYFNASSGARKGLISKIKFTSKGGYAYRKMIYVMSNVRLSDTIKDCGTRYFAKFKITEDIFDRMGGRYSQDSPGGKLIPITKDMIGNIVNVRSPIYCKSLDICKICYGDLYKQIGTRNIGILAAQECTSLSEKIMKAFHIGGAVSYSSINLLDSLKENITKDFYDIVDKSFYQDGFNLINKEEITLLIDKNIFKKSKYRIRKEEEKYILPVGYFSVKFSSYNIMVTIEEEIVINLKNIIGFEESNDLIVITFSPNTAFLSCYPKDMSPEKVSVMIDKYVGGKTPWTTPESLFYKLYKILSKFSDWDCVHLEVIVGNILRWRKDPRLPARVKYPYDPVTYSVKDLPSVISWPIGIAYEDFNKSITFGLISDKGIDTPIEKLFFGEPLSGDGK